MRRLFVFFLGLLAFSVLLSGCVTTGGPTSAPTVMVVEKLHCVANSGIRIAVEKVRCKATTCRKKPNAPGGLPALLQLADKVEVSRSTVKSGIF